MRDEYIVSTPKVAPIVIIPSIISMILTKKYIVDIGTPVTVDIIIAKPDAPPAISLDGTRKK